MRSAHPRTPLPEDIAARVSVEFGDRAPQALRLLGSPAAGSPALLRSPIGRDRG